MAITSLYTIVRNIASTPKSFTFLPPHGVELAPGEQYQIPGDLLAWLTRDQYRLEKFRHFEMAIGGYTKDGVAYPPTLAVLQTPAARYFDDTDNNTKVLTVVDGAVVVANPDTGALLTELTGSFVAIADTTSAVTGATLNFSAPVVNFTKDDLRLTRGGTPVAIPNATATSSDGKAWVIGGLAAYTATNGAYVLSVAHTNSGIRDVYQNELTTDITEGWAKS